MKAKLFSLFLSLVIGSATLFASDISVDGIWYDFDSNTQTASVTYRGSSYYSCSNEYTGSVVIPSSVTYNNTTYSVTSIGESAFYDCSGLTSVTIPNSVTSIGEIAFYGCSGLTSVTIGNSVTSIGDWAFADCSSLPVIDNIRYADTYLVEAVDRTLTSYNIKEGTKWIGSYAFYGYSGLTSVTIPNSVTSIGDSAFRGCSGLTSITIPNSVTSIGSQAFYGCSGLTSVTIPNSVTSIGNSAFRGCSGLTSITIPNSVTSIGSNAFRDCSGLTSVTIPNSVTRIGDWAFQNCSGLTSVTCLGETPAELGSNVFYDCSNLNAIYVPCGTLNAYKNTWSSYASIIKYLNFEYKLIGNVNIQEAGNVILPQNVCEGTIITAIPNYGYHFVQWSDGNTENPRTIVLTQDTTFTAEFAKNEYTITVTSTNPEWGTTTGDTTALYLEQVEISATSNYGYHFVRWNDGSTQNPRTITITEDKTYQAIFAKNTYSITKQTIAEQGTITGKSQAEYLDSVILNAIPNYGYHFTQWSDGITDNPRTIELTQDTTFTALFGIDTEGACGDDNLLTWTFDSINHVLSISGEGALNSNYTFGVQAPTQTDTLIIAEGVTAIGKSAFKGMSPTLSSVTFANTVSSIGDYAFAGCQKIDYLALPSSLKSIGSYAFKDLVKIKLLNLPNEVEKIGEHAFDSCILVTSIYLGNAVEEIGDYAFKGCIRVNDITCMNTTTPVVYENTLTSISPLAYLFVQAGSKRTYQLDPYWSRFDIHEITTDETTVTTDSVIIDAHDDYVVITWPTNDAASTYTIVITKNGAVFCTLTFNAEGQLTGIAFAPSRSGNAHAPYAMEVANGLQFTVTGLDVASKYEYGLTAADENARALVTYHGEFATSGYQGDINPGGEAEKHIFRIRFLDWDGTELQASDVFEGDVPQFNGITPIREDDEQYTYTFAGWTPEIVAVVAEAIYTATYTAAPKTEGIEDVDGENSAPRKVVINGQIYILRGDKMYTIQGQEVK